MDNTYAPEHEPDLAPAEMRELLRHARRELTRGDILDQLLGNLEADRA